ncbi:uncharacterized protein BCR38DRAFT_60275 [Pseudomassariella vexata]|uniref:Uncharacterized protein n=1 Tax=Pseudomassariella vexata TaxID=1141098 RepID=A0A1Y2DKC5_9PEZI|nr:uncharacterized protein BCR38DRAFT_60275 [Pseudomassariella vexata]ORY59624.1 hypothetical protein BCR38DRAFT_60275 [Pseudomassariella vexata]
MLISFGMCVALFVQRQSLPQGSPGFGHHQHPAISNYEIKNTCVGTAPSDGSNSAQQLHPFLRETVLFGVCWHLCKLGYACALSNTECDETPRIDRAFCARYRDLTSFL